MEIVMAKDRARNKLDEMLDAGFDPEQIIEKLEELENE